MQLSEWGRAKCRRASIQWLLHHAGTQPQPSRPEKGDTDSDLQLLNIAETAQDRSFERALGPASGILRPPDLLNLMVEGEDLFPHILESLNAVPVSNALHDLQPLL